MNAVRRALEIVDSLLDQRHWARVITFPDRVYFEAGPIYEDGTEECPTRSGVVFPDGRVVEGERRI
jgi:hypothetical protein